MTHIPQRFVLRSQVLVLLAYIISTSFLLTAPGSATSIESLQLVGAGIGLGALLLVMSGVLIAGVMTNGPHGKMIVTKGVMDSYFAILFSAFIATESVPAWSVHAYAPAILTFLFAVFVMGFAATHSYCWYTKNEGRTAFWNAKSFWKFWAFYATFPLSAVFTFAYFANGGVIPTSQTTIAEAGPLIFLSVLLAVQFIWAALLEGPFANEWRAEEALA